MLRINVPAIAIRGFHTTSVCNIVRVRAGRYKCSKKRTVPLTYEQAKPPYLIGVEKAWNSWNTSMYAAVCLGILGLNTFGYVHHTEFVEAI